MPMWVMVIHMDEDVEKWIEELLKNGTFESREDIYEFCVYAVKTFCEADGLNRKSVKKAFEEHGENLKEINMDTVIPEQLFPIKLSRWKKYLDYLRDWAKYWQDFFRNEAEEDAENAGERFIETLKDIDKGDYDKNSPIHGRTGEIKGSSDNANVSLDFKTAKEMESCKYPIPVVSMGGLGPQYDDACFVLFLRFWKWFDEHPEKYREIEERGHIPDDVEKELTKLTDDINPSGAMYGASLTHALFVKKNGYSKWIDKGRKEGRIVIWKPHIDIVGGDAHD